MCIYISLYGANRRNTAAPQATILKKLKYIYILYYIMCIYISLYGANRRNTAAPQATILKSTLSVLVHSTSITLSVLVYSTSL